jgi:hypothetical protein
MAKGKKTSKSDLEHYKNYNYEKNRKARLEKLAKAQPNNPQIQAALKNIHYRRKTPKLKAWTPHKKEMAEMNALAKRSIPLKEQPKLGYAEELANAKLQSM